MSAPCRPGKQPEMATLLRRPGSAGAQPCPGRSSLDRACAPAEYDSYREARTGKISQIKVSTLSGEPRRQHPVGERVFGDPAPLWVVGVEGCASYASVVSGVVGSAIQPSRLA